MSEPGDRGPLGPGGPRSFYRLRGEGFEPTAAATGPWSVRHQHGGPPSALLGRALELCLAEGPGRLARVSVQLLRPVPLEPLTVSTQLESGTRRVRRGVAELRAGDQLVAVARGLWLRTQEVTLAAFPGVPGAPPPPPLPGPEGGEVLAFPFFQAPVSYKDAVEGRFVKGRFGSGATTAWLRLRLPLVEGEPTSPWQRVLALVDAANGTTARLDYTTLVFVNPDLDVTLVRQPRGEWLALEGTAAAEGDGVGLVDARLFDRDGPVGRVSQTLVIEARRAPDT